METLSSYIKSGSITREPYAPATTDVRARGLFNPATTDVGARGLFKCELFFHYYSTLTLLRLLYYSEEPYSDTFGTQICIKFCRDWCGTEGREEERKKQEETGKEERRTKKKNVLRYFA